MSRSNSTPELLANLYKKPLRSGFSAVNVTKFYYIVGKIEKHETLSASRKGSP